MEIRISKSQFKPKALQYFRQVQERHDHLVITDLGKPVVRIVPYQEEPDQTLRSLQGSLVKYDEPTKPSGEESDGPS